MNSWHSSFCPMFVCPSFHQSFWCNHSSNCKIQECLSSLSKSTLLNVFRRSLHVMELRCPLCSKECKSKIGYAEHLICHKNAPHFSFPCPKRNCVRTFASALGIYKHLCRDHRPNENYRELPREESEETTHAKNVHHAKCMSILALVL